MTLWAKWTLAHFPDNGGQWQRSWAFNAPILLFNAAMELLAAACAFLLTRLWVRRATPDPKPFCGWAPALVAGLLFWFNPAVIVSAHGWPTWDMWIIPMYLLAVLLASVECWFLAGLAVAVGRMFKGQQLAVAAVFVIWPLVMGNWGAARCGGARAWYSASARSRRPGS
jgi:hypothetical protein